MIRTDSLQFLAALTGFGLGVTATGNSSDCGTPKASVASTYFAGYHADQGFPVSSMQWQMFTDVKYAFAETSPDGSLNLTASLPDQIPSFVSAAKANNVKAQVSIGGWTGSRWFSSSVGSAENRTAFVKTCLDLVKQYSLDGLDFDWEYPNRQGLGCNVINDDDTANFLSFLQELRQQPEGKSLYLTAAGSLFPWYNETGKSASDLSGFADVLDYVMIMNYDIYGAWAPTGGPNAPLEFSCDSRNNQGGGKEGVAKWAATGIPSNKIVLGVAAYGHGFSVNSTNAFDQAGALNAFPTQNSTNRFQGSSWDNDPPVDPCGAAQPHSGTYQFWSLIKEAKVLTESGDPVDGISYGFDSCSQTPYLYNKDTEIWISYDNAQSLTAKGQFIMANALAGFSMWEAGGDYNNILIKSIRSATGLGSA